MNKLVARFADGRVLKGCTVDFAVSKDTFHLAEPAPHPGRNPVEIDLTELKALFFVKDFEGDPSHVDRMDFETPPLAWERGVIITFKDGERLVGTTPKYHPIAPGFFVVPADRESNNQRCYVIESAIADVCYV